MQIFTKEKRVVELALGHLDKADESLQIMIPAIRDYAGGQRDHLDDARAAVDELETAADSVLREIRDLLYSGAYLPTIRGDLYRLLAAVDKVANRVEDCLDFVAYQRPARVDRFSAEIGGILDLTAQCFESLRIAIEIYFNPDGEMDQLRTRTIKVSKLESAIDRRQRDLTTAIFTSELSLAEKLHLADLLLHLVRISDQGKSAASELELLSLKSII
ncbi:MAG: DUF47 family protein [Woeseiaceae bacterium]|jgi:uncharacterized protein